MRADRQKQLVVGLLDCRVSKWSDYESLKCPWQYWCNRDWFKFSWMRRLLHHGYWRDDGGFPLTWYHTCNDGLIKQPCDRCRKNRVSSRKNQAGIPSKPAAVAFKLSNIWKTSIYDIQSVSSASSCILLVLPHLIDLHLLTPKVGKTISK